MVRELYFILHCEKSKRLGPVPTYGVLDIHVLVHLQ